MTEQWQELKETIAEMRDNGGTGTQQEVCKFLADYIDILEKQIKEKGKMSKKFTDLAKDEIRFIVNEMFKPKKITNIKAHKRDDEITCTIYTEWETTDDDGNDIIEVIPDEITLRNPFDYGEESIYADFGLNSSDYTKLKQFCYAKGIYGQSIEWLINNPYVI